MNEQLSRDVEYALTQTYPRGVAWGLQHLIMQLRDYIVELEKQLATEEREKS